MVCLGRAFALVVVSDKNAGISLVGECPKIKSAGGIKTIPSSGGGLLQDIVDINKTKRRKIRVKRRFPRSIGSLQVKWLGGKQKFPGGCTHAQLIDKPLLPART